MKRKTVITWQDVVKLAIGITIGLTPAILIMKRHSILSPKPSTEKSPSAHTEEKSPNIIMTDSVYMEYGYIPTVEDILTEREELRHALWVDSVYMTIPENILTQILVTKGTQISVEKIVEEYVKNKNQYDGNKWFNDECEG